MATQRQTRPGTRSWTSHLAYRYLSSATRYTWGIDWKCFEIGIVRVPDAIAVLVGPHTSYLLDTHSYGHKDARCSGTLDVAVVPA